MKRLGCRDPAFHVEDGAGVPPAVACLEVLEEEMSLFGDWEQLGV